MAEPRRLAERVALITGASRGIGRAVALRFAAEGAHVVCAGRSQAALEELDDAVRGAGGNATLVPGDLREPGLIDRMAAAIAERWQRLDILVGNAGVLGAMGPLAHSITPDGWDEVIAVNLTANWHLIRACDPLLRASPAGRAIFVTSGAAAAPRPYWGPYAVSKAALEMLVLTYAAEVARTPVRVNLVDPARTRTRMRAAAYPGEDPATVKPPESVAATFIDLAAADCERHGETVRCTG